MLVSLPVRHQLATADADCARWFRSFFAVDIARRMGIPMLVQASGTGWIVLRDNHTRRLPREYLELFGQELEL